MSSAIYPVLAGLGWNIGKAPMFNTKVQTAVSLAELRASFSSTPIYQVTQSYDLVRDNVVNNELKTLAGFYLSRFGEFDSFLYQDPDDYQATNEYFGTGYGSVNAFQLMRAFGSFSENICNIAAHPLIYIDGVLKTETTDYSISATGLVTFVVTPTAAVTLTWTGTYYMRCRFHLNNNPLNFNQFMRKLWELKTVDFYGSFGTKI